MNFQEKKWSQDFGQSYTNRNEMDLDKFEEYYKSTYGIPRLEMNMKFLNDLPKNIKILEVGCNIGNQLLFLKNMGFTNLTGIDVQEYALEKAKLRLPEVKFYHGTGLELPFKDGEFDLVFTSGVLIHISPENISKIVDEMIRCTKRYIWGFEYYSEKYTQINYRGSSDLLWKTNFADEFMKRNTEMKVLKEEKYKWIENENICQMYLIDKI